MNGLEGMTLGGSRILERIGGGGMGDVYLAEQIGLGRRVAVKVARTGVGAHGEQAEIARRFSQEALAVAALEHPHILPIYSYGEQEGIHYLIMPYVAEGSLADILAPGPLHQLSLPLAPALALDIISQAVDALAYAHQQGVIHRDIKPHNLLVRRLSPRPSAASQLPVSELPGATPRLHVLLADFGLARFLAEFTGATGTTGTPLYSAPEQYQGHPGPGTDQYALACVAYLLLAGRPVFDGTVAELHHQHLSVAPTPITRLRSTLPPAVDTVFTRALAKDPRQRFPSIEEFGAALSAALAPVAHATPDDERLSPPALPAFPPVSGTVASPADALPTPRTSAAYTEPTATASLAPTVPPPRNASPMVPTVVSPYISSPMSPAGLGQPAPPSQSRSAVAVSGGADAPGSPVPRLARRKLPRNQASPRRRKRTIITLVAALALVVIGSVGYTVYRQSQPTVAPLVQFDTIARKGVVNASRLSQLGPGAVSAQATLPLRALHAEQANTVSADSIAALPSLPSTAAQLTPDPTSLLLQAKYALGQEQVSAPALMNTSIGASDHVVIEAVDGAIQVFGFNGQSDWQAIATSGLFAPVLQTGDALGQPRVLFDVASQRWIVVVNETATQDGGVTTGYFDLAVSQDAQPFSLWTVYQIATGADASANCAWADDPQIGSDASALYLTGNTFACGAQGTFLGATLWELPKKTFLAGVGSRFVRWLGVFNNEQHRRVFTLTPAVESGGDKTEWLMSNDAGYLAPGVISKQVTLWAVLNPAVAETNITPTLAKLTVALPTPYADPPAAAQPGTPAPLAVGDARVGSLVFAGGHLFATFTTAVNWQGDHSTRAGAYWVDIVPSATIPATGVAHTAVTATLRQSGVLGFAGGYVFQPALAADATGAVALVASVSASGVYPGLLYARRHGQDPPNTLGASGGVALLAKGASTYNGAHWGDYSGVCLSVPTDNAAPSAWVAGPYMTDHPAHWQTLAWQLLV